MYTSTLVQRQGCGKSVMEQTWRERLCCGSGDDVLSRTEDVASGVGRVDCCVVWYGIELGWNRVGMV